MLLSYAPRKQKTELNGTKGQVLPELVGTLADLDKLMRLEAFLSDLPDSRQEVVFADLKNKSTEELRDMIRMEVEAVGELETTVLQDGSGGVGG